MPRKRFGQHFLRDQQIIYQIVNAIAPLPQQHLVEIGPGQGALTTPLLEQITTLDVIEIDRDLAQRLRQQPRLRVHEGDVLKFDFRQLATSSTSLRIVGNLPYNISTPLLFHLMQFRDCLSDMVFMLQKEVVLRLTATPGSTNYGRLSVMMQYHCAMEYLFDVPPAAFFPPPKVDSSVIQLHPYTQPPVHIGDEVRFARLVAQAFSQRRKTLRNTLKSLISAEQISAIGIDPQRRAETLTLAEFAQLTAVSTSM